MDPSSLFFIVINWNLADDTAACVRSLFLAGARSGHVIVLDNGSGDNSASRLRTEFGDRIRLIESQTNLGFAGGNNLAIAYALSVGAEWLFLLNNDTIVAPTILRKMAAMVRLHPSFRIFSPLILYANEPHRIWSLGDRIIGGTLLTRGLLRGQPIPASLQPFVEADSLNGCAMMIHRSVFVQVGGFDIRYFMYAEDVDFCWRARTAGFRMGCCTDAVMWHKVSHSTGAHDQRSRYWRTANQIRFYRTNAGGAQRTMLFLFTLARVLRLGMADLLHHRYAAAQATVSAWRDGWFEP